MTQFGVVVTPALVYLRDGKAVELVARMRDWPVFAQGMRAPAGDRRARNTGNGRKRMTEHVLTWRPRVSGEGTVDTDDQLRLIGMPTGLVRAARQALAADQLTAPSREVLHEVLADLERRKTAPDTPPTRFSLAGLDEADKATVADILGEGDVWARWVSGGVLARRRIGARRRVAS
jgi:hypothetical protein